MSAPGSLAALTDLVARVRATSKKLEKVALIAALLRQVRGREVELLALYLTGSLPQGRIGVGSSALQNALVDTPAQGEPLTLVDVDAVLESIARERGTGSAERRARALRALVERADSAGRRFLAELLMGEVRQGALDGLVQEAIAQAAGLTGASVRQAAMFAPNLGVVARAALEQGALGLAPFSLRLLSPVAPMLANAAEDVGEALERLEHASFEYKLDGARVQVHKAGDEVRVFTRQLQDVTGRVPEIVEWARALSAREVLLEGEALALRADGRPHPFQVTMRRFGRSKDVETARRDLPLSWFFFDSLYREGEGPLIALPYAERVERLVADVPAAQLLPRLVTGDTDAAQHFLRQALDAGHEGLMAKSLTAPYNAGQRGSHWLKLKAAHTLDLVVLAAEWGNGRRQGWLSNLHLGARDTTSGQFVMLGKTFKGLTDEMLRWQTEKILALETRRDGHVVYVRPELVAEIAFNEVQESPRYPGGFALRFARVKAHRPEKSAAEADTFQTVLEIFRRQRA